MRGFFRSLFGKILIIAVAVILVGAALLAIFGEGSSVFRRTALAIVSPFQKGYTAVYNAVERFFAAGERYDDLLKENEDLRAQIAELEGQLRDVSEIMDENVSLRDLLGMKQRHESYDIINATIIGWSDTSWRSCFTVNRGSDDGVELGDCVISHNGLVGRVSELGAGYAEVTTLLDPSSGIGVSVVGNGVTALAKGQLEYMDSDRLLLSSIPHGSNIFAGDLLETSGLGGSIPPGLIVGRVERVSASPDGMGDYAVAVLAEDVSALTGVYIILDFSVEE